jgi:hypothetical protein
MIQLTIMSSELQHSTSGAALVDQKRQYYRTETTSKELNSEQCSVVVSTLTLYLKGHKF